MREIIGVRLRQERERLGFNQVDFAKLGGASKRSLIDWEQGKLVPNAEFLAAVAVAGADVNYVITGSYVVSVLSRDESELVAGFRSLDLRGKTGVLALISGMAQPEPKVKNVFHGGVGQVVEGNINTPQTFNFGIDDIKKR